MPHGSDTRIGLPTGPADILNDSHSKLSFLIMLKKIGRLPASSLWKKCAMTLEKGLAIDANHERRLPHFAEQSYLFLTDYARFSWIILWKKPAITYFFNSKERNIAFFTLFLNKPCMYCPFRSSLFPLPSFYLCLLLFPSKPILSNLFCPPTPAYFS